MRLDHSEGVQGAAHAQNHDAWLDCVRQSNKHVRKGAAAHQGGFAAILMVLAVFGAALALAAGVEILTVIAAKQRAHGEQSEYLNGVINQAQHWYAANMQSIESTATPMSEASLLGQIAPDVRSGLRAQMSDQLGQPCASTTFTQCVAYRVIVVWLPPPSNVDASTFNVQTGVFTPDPEVISAGTYRIYNAMRDQLSAVQTAQQTMDDLAQNLRLWSQAQMLNTQTSSSDNYFRSASCAASDSTHLPCQDTPVDINTTTIPMLLGLDNSAFTAPWGSHIEFSNATASSSPPFSLTLTLTSPWGSSDVLVVEQPQ